MRLQNRRKTYSIRLYLLIGIWRFLRPGIQVVMPALCVGFTLYRGQGFAKTSISDKENPRFF